MAAKQVVFTNEVLYERNIGDRIWPQFIDAQQNNDVKAAFMAVKCYFLLTQQWYKKESDKIKKRIYEVDLAISKPITRGEEKTARKKREDAWEEIESIWCEISDNLESYGLFKRNYTPENNKLALPTR